MKFSSIGWFRGTIGGMPAEGRPRSTSPRNQVAAIRRLRRATEKDDPEALRGFGTRDPAPRAAVAWFRRTAAAGEMDALLPLAQAELHGLGTRRNVSGAIKKLRRVACAHRTAAQLDRQKAMCLVAATGGRPCDGFAGQHSLEALRLLDCLPTLELLRRSWRWNAPCI
jgi:TPR repeat protein